MNYRIEYRRLVNGAYGEEQFLSGYETEQTGLHAHDLRRTEARQYLLNFFQIKYGILVQSVTPTIATEYFELQCEECGDNLCECGQCHNRSIDDCDMYCPLFSAPQETCADYSEDLLYADTAESVR